ncbi:hypothetical protein KR009_012310, partial [Drosophila setifemur]
APLTSLKQLDLYVTNEILNLVTSSLKDVANFNQRIIDEATHVLPPGTKSDLLMDLKKFVMIVKSLDIDESIDLNQIFMLEANDMANAFNLPDSAELSSEADLAVMRIIKQHNVNSFVDKQIGKYQKTLDRIEEKIQIYITDLPDNSFKRRRQFIKWINNFKNEKDVSKKLFMLVNNDLF